MARKVKPGSESNGHLAPDLSRRSFVAAASAAASGLALAPGPARAAIVATDFPACRPTAMARLRPAFARVPSPASTA